MKCIVPLAGPDIYSDQYGLKAGLDLGGEPLISKTIHSRSWFGREISENDLIFVIREFVSDALLKSPAWSNNCC